MTTPDSANPLAPLAGRLEALLGLLAQAPGACAQEADSERPVEVANVAATDNSVAGATALRPALEAESAQADALGRPDLADALGRLALLVELIECLAAETPEAASALKAFCKRALVAIAAAARAPETLPDLAWITAESSAQWGPYLDLLGPAQSDLALDEEAAAEAEAACYADVALQPDDAPPDLDLDSLLRLLGSSATARPEPGPDQEAALAPPRGPVAEPEPDHEPLARPADGGAPAAPAATPDHAALLAALEPELREAFLADATDLFERIGALMLEDLSQPQAMRELGRCFHTLKGAAGSVGLSDLVKRIHSLEDRLEAAAAQTDQAPIDALHETIGYLESILYNLQPAQPLARPAQPAWTGELPTNVLPAAAPFTAEPASALLAEASTAAPGPADGSIRVSCERIDEMMDLLSELITRRILWAAQAETIKEFAATAHVARNRLMGSVDRLRGLLPQRASAGAAVGPEATGLVHRLAEQADDLAALAETARAAADPLADDADVLARVSLRLWDALQAVRVLPVRGLFHRLARVARDAARVEGRAIEIAFTGEDVGLDRSIQDRAYEPLLHAVRNAVGHGIEPVEERLRAGKPPVGRVTLEARREGYTMLLKVQDDGRGLDYEAIAAQGRKLGLIEPAEEPTLDRLNALVFQSGFSTRAHANAVAGRGVGMDVVAQEVARLHGTVSLCSQRGAGTALTIRLPARLALEQAMVVRVEGRPFALPLGSIELADQLAPAQREGPDWSPSVRLRERSVPLLDARRLLGFAPAPAGIRPKLLLVRALEQSVALSVDAIDGPRELVVKPLGALLAGHPLVAGTSLSPAGELVLVLDPCGLAARQCPDAAGHAPEPAAQARRALVVDDAISVRRAARRHLRTFGLETDEAADGIEALRKLRSGSYRLIVTDLDMPRMDGFELLAELGRSGVSAATPVVAISTRCDLPRRRRALQLGARALLAKPIGPNDLADTIGPLLTQETAPALAQGY